MDFLKSHIFTSFLISIIYFIIKNIIYRFDTNLDTNSKKQLFKDSILLFIISYLILIFKDKLFFFNNQKTEIFTNEPNF